MNPVAQIPVEEWENLTVVEIGEMLYQLDAKHYRYRPVTIEEFICSSDFLNIEFQGEFYPYWLKELMRVHPTPVFSPFYEVMTSQPIGSGKSTSSLVSIAYEIYKMFCLKDPHEFYSILPRKVKLVFMLFSSTKTVGSDVNWSILSSYLDCPWFRKCPHFNSDFSLNTTSYIADLGGGVFAKVGSQSGQALGQAVFGGVLDEADFQNDTAQRNQAHESYLNLMRRMESRFLEKGGYIPGKLWLISSPKNETAFLSGRIKEINEKGSKHTMIIPATPIWEILEGTSKGRKRYTYQNSIEPDPADFFKIFLGDEQYDPCLLDPDDPRPLPPDRITEVPIEHEESFQKDLIESIRDIVGDAVASAVNLFPKSTTIDHASTLPQRFDREYIEIDYYDTVARIEDYAHTDYFADPMFPECLRFCHVDNAYSKDYIGISGVFAKSDYTVEQSYNAGTRLVEVNRTERFYMQDFVLCMRRKGASKEIPFYKIKFFFQFLRELGYPLGLITFDQFQSKQLMQELEVDGFEVGHLSVDGKHSRAPYHSLKSRMAQKKLLLVKHPRQMKELRELRDDGDLIDHPTNGSKDMADSLCGAHWNCSASSEIYQVSEMVKSHLSEDPMKNVNVGLTKNKLRKIISSKPNRIIR